MKRVTLFGIFLLGSFCFATAQSKDHYGDYPELYKGKSFIVSPAFLSYQQSASYTGKEEPLTTVPNLNVRKKVTEGKGRKAKTTLENEKAVFSDIIKDTLKVVDVIPIDQMTGKSWEIELQSVRTGLMYFYSYNYHRWSFPFDVVEPLELPDNFFCNEVFTKNDPYEKTKETNSKPDDVTFFKTEKSGVVSHFIGLRTYSSSPNSLKSDKAILLFEDDETLEIDAEIEVNTTGGSSSIPYMVTSVKYLTPYQIEKLKSSRLKGFRLGYDDEEITLFDGFRFMELAKCVF